MTNHEPANYADETLNENAYIIPCTSFSEITNQTLAFHSSGQLLEEKVNLNLIPDEITINYGAFINPGSSIPFPGVVVLRQADKLVLSCACPDNFGKLCDHQQQTLFNLLNRQELRIFFDEKLRSEKIKKLAADYGLEKEQDLDGLFEVKYLRGKIEIKPKNPAILPVTKESLAAFHHKIKSPDDYIPQANNSQPNSSRCIILKQHKYYRHLYIELLEAQTTREGKLKNPFASINPLEEIWKTEDHRVIKFYTALSRFQNNIDEQKTAADLVYLTAIISNPLSMPVYLHNSEISGNIAANSVFPIKLKILTEAASLQVTEKGQFYEVSGSLQIDGKPYAFADLKTRFNYFLQISDALYLAKSAALLALLDFFKGKGASILIHHSKFKDFNYTVLNELENNIHISRPYIKPASVKQIKKSGFDLEPEKIIYLSDFGQHISIVPVMRYGEIEIPVRTKHQIYAEDDKGKKFMVKRNNENEDQFVALLLRQHPDFAGQLENQLPYFYLHKQRFLDEDWFLNAFEDWDAGNITVLGFDEITENKINPQKAKVSIQVISGVNWFNTVVDVRYGKKKASLKHLHHAIKTKSKYVRLDDGSTGIIPAEWVEKFAAYFAAAEIVEDTLRTPRINFASVAEIYEEKLLSEEVKGELKEYHKRFDDYNQIESVKIPATLNATLRPYQQHGLNWLNFLDDFNFGGCLADDMGLGKTLQIIAFILSQREKRGHTTNLVVVPTSLIFNWQNEIEKFAPSLKTHTVYGASRIKSIREFDRFEVILTSYGTLVSDIGYFKKFNFNYVFFDESQNIKNPQSQRYMAGRALNSRSKIVITGTPIENNTFDLYGQLSVSCPGLLRNLKYFRDVYSTPIDKFGVRKRAVELQQKIDPFILRRTKAQVTTELPEKIEMVIYCEMEAEQRKLYNAYEKEFREFISAKTDDEIIKSPMHVLKGLTRLRQICDSPVLVGEDKLSAGTSSKIETLITHIEDKSPGHKILVFSQFVTMLNLIREQLHDKGIACSYLTGSIKNRAAVIQEFQTDANIPVFLISLKAGGTGLNLTAADYVYIVDPWWNPAVENQAIDRCYRIGQKKNVVAVRLICPDTVEEKIMNLQQSKTDRMNGLIKTDSAMLKSLTKTNLINLFTSATKPD